MNVRGFSFNGIEAGIKKKGGKDLGLIFSRVPAGSSGVFTRNWVKAAPLVLTQQRLQKRCCQAVLVNSGKANACTGAQGLIDAQTLADETARLLGIPAELTAVASTGVIGEPLPVETIAGRLPFLCNSLNGGTIEDFAQAIMTTDTVPKIATRHGIIGGKRVNIAGVAKGAGMINPSLATMLVFLVTDASIKPQSIQSILTEGADRSFNRITIDGDTSTNDTVLLLANGMAGNQPLARKDLNAAGFTDMLFSVMEELAQSILKDGEGVTKVITIAVQKARSQAEAEAIGRSIAHSPLVKTAFFGEELNWGRIVAAAGKTVFPVAFERMDLLLNGIFLVRQGTLLSREQEAEAQRELKKAHLTITLVLNQGRHQAVVFTTDLSPQYVHINAGYKS